MNIEYSIIAKNIPVLRLSGELDLRNVAKVRHAIREMTERPNTDMIVNISELDFIDCSGLGVLVGGLAHVRGHDGSMKLACNNQRILNVFAITRLTKLFDIYETDDAAARGLMSQHKDA
jgi:anti-sigma B factor antagonist